LTFQDAQQRLLADVRDGIHNGELMERGFARMIGVSQPHVHNVLKGVRNLSPELSDSILKLLHRTLLDLASSSELEASQELRKISEPIRELAFLEAPIGPGMPWPAGLDRRNFYPAPFRAPAPLPGVVTARLIEDPGMQATLAGYTLAVLDTSQRRRADPSPEGLYAVERGGETVLRYIRPGAHCYYLLTDSTLKSPEQWEQLSISPGELPQFVKARVLWLGREK
jgi:plasmid maintenance system antidote protein VapI